MAYNGQPRNPAWFPSEGRNEFTILEPPYYDGPGKPGKRVDDMGQPVPYWPADVRVDGAAHVWYMSYGELKALAGAGKPTKGARVICQKTTGRGITCVLLEAGEPPQQAPPPQAGPVRAPAPQVQAYDLGRRIDARVLIHRRMVAAFAQADVVISDDALSAAVTGELIEWSRSGSPELPPALPPQREGDDIPF